MNDSATDTRIIDGRAFAAGLRARIAARVDVLKSDHGIEPGLAVVLVGENPASEVYVRNKAKQTRAAGMRSFEHRLPATTSQAELLALVRRLNDDPHVSGILVQLPLPAQIGADAWSSRPSIRRRTSTAFTPPTPVCSRSAATAWSRARRWAA